MWGKWTWHSITNTKKVVHAYTVLAITLEAKFQTGMGYIERPYLKNQVPNNSKIGL